MDFKSCFNLWAIQQTQTQTHTNYPHSTHVFASIYVRYDTPITPIRNSFDIYIQEHNMFWCFSDLLLAYLIKLHALTHSHTIYIYIYVCVCVCVCVCVYMCVSVLMYVILLYMLKDGQRNIKTYYVPGCKYQKSFWSVLLACRILHKWK